MSKVYSSNFILLAFVLFMIVFPFGINHKFYGEVIQGDFKDGWREIVNNKFSLQPSLNLTNTTATKNGMRIGFLYSFGFIQVGKGLLTFHFTQDWKVSTVVLVSDIILSNIWNYLYLSEHLINLPLDKLKAEKEDILNRLFHNYCHLYSFKLPICKI